MFSILITTNYKSFIGATAKSNSHFFLQLGYELLSSNLRGKRVLFGICNGGLKSLSGKFSPELMERAALRIFILSLSMLYIAY